jgi:hypothetical protein
LRWTSTLNRSFPYVSKIQVSDPDYDLLSFIQHLWKFSPITWSIQHVKENQDDDKDRNEVDRLGKLNIKMDGLAKGHNEYAKSCLRYYVLSYEPWSIWINDTKIIKKINHILYETVHTPKVPQYWTKKAK